MDSRPAISDMGARMGSEPSARSTVSYAMQVDLQDHEGQQDVRCCATSIGVPCVVDRDGAHET